MKFKQIENAVLAAVDDLFKRDSLLLEYDANERSITHKLAEYLTKHFQDPYSVDCEYNRIERNPKYVKYAKDVPTDDTTARTVYPDIIVHERGKPNNLLVIEVKRSWSTATAEIDLKKLADIAYDRDYNYEFGLFLNISTGNDIKNTAWAKGIWFVKGKRQSEEPILLHQMRYIRTDDVAERG